VSGTGNVYVLSIGDRINVFETIRKRHYVVKLVFTGNDESRGFDNGALLSKINLMCHLDTLCHA
jgi:hypothetical protein